MEPSDRWRTRPKSAAHLRELVHDPWWMVPRMQMVDRHGVVQRVGDVWRPEQRQLLHALTTQRRVLVLKPRQIGATTLATAWLAWRAWSSKRSIGLLSVTHEEGSQFRVNSMLRTYLQQLPQPFRPQFTSDNAYSIRCAHNGAELRQTVAGGRGQGRSFSFHAAHFSEAGYFPRGSAATADAEAAADESVYASTLATLHPGASPWDGQILVESTAAGPAGLFYRLTREAQRPNSGWAFLFFPWHAFAEYELDVPDEAAFRAELDDDEKRLLEPVHAPDGTLVREGLSLRKVAWRRNRLRVDNIDPVQFKRDYPETWEEPFIASSRSKWFDVYVLNRMLAQLPVSRINNEAFNEYVRPEPGRRYVIGADTGGGVDLDASVACVLRDDGHQVAVYRSAKVKPHEFAEVIAKLSARFNRATVLAEANKYGKAVINRLQSMGVPVWKDDDGKDWWTNGGNNDTKRMLMDHAAAQLARGFVAINDPVTIQEMLTVVEFIGGNIAAENSGHDDHVMAWCFAVWALRRIASVTVSTSNPTTADRIARIKRLTA